MIREFFLKFLIRHYRRQCLFGLNSDLNAELKYLNAVTNDNQKNYQVWYHRLAILEKLGTVSAEEELSFIDTIFDEDSKNYHAWAHRQWVVKRFNLWQVEMQCIDKLLTKDLRNNSAWNHRFYVLKHTKGTVPQDQAAAPPKFIDYDLSDQVRCEELDYAFNFIKSAPNNESAWNYLYGIASYKGGSDAAMQKLLAIAMDLLKRAPINVFAHWVIVEFAEYRVNKHKDSLTKDERVNLL